MLQCVTFSAKKIVFREDLFFPQVTTTKVFAAALPSGHTVRLFAHCCARQWGAYNCLTVRLDALARLIASARLVASAVLLAVVAGLRILLGLFDRRSVAADEFTAASGR